MFCDELTIKVTAGSGGNGAVSFRREKFVAKGGPDGGDGGRGGNIIIRVNHNLNTLGHLAHKKHYKAESGENGRGKNQHGKGAEDLIIEVPPGTIVFNKEKKEVIADLKQEEEQQILAKGGKGGLGNARFASSTHQVPRFAEKGEPGEEKELTLELKMVADVGIIGLPSAGKSTLISVISNARPKIAAYHFTTLVPNLGVVSMGSFGGSAYDTFLVADIPGLIEGASQGKGLGHQFLRHISRTKLLIHLIDGTLEQPAQNYKIIKSELKNFEPGLAQKTELVVINKIDMLSATELTTLKKELKKTTKAQEIFTISALTREGIKPLIYSIVEKLKEIKAAEQKAQESEFVEIPILRPGEKPQHFTIKKVVRKKTHKIYHIDGPRINQLVIMTDTANPEGLERIYHYLQRMGIQKAVEKQGAVYGDILRIEGKNIPYRTSS